MVSFHIIEHGQSPHLCLPLLRPLVIFLDCVKKSETFLLESLRKTNLKMSYFRSKAKVSKIVFYVLCPITYDVTRAKRSEDESKSLGTKKTAYYGY